MAPSKLILICQAGGEFKTKDDGTLSYTGGDAHAIEMNSETKFDGLKSKLAEMCNFDITTITLKYFLPSNKQIQISLANDKDLKRMYEFHSGSVTAEVFVYGKEGYVRENIAVDDVTIEPIETETPILDLKNSRRAVKSTPKRKIAARSSKRVQARTATITDDLDDENLVPVTVNLATDNEFLTDMTASPADTVKKRRRVASRKKTEDNLIVDVQIDEDDGVKGSSSRKRAVRKHTSVSSSDEDYEAAPLLDYSSNRPLEEIVESWKEGITGVDHEFKDVHEFRDALQKYAIANRFSYKMKKNDSTRVSGNCIVEGCSWKIHASWVPSDKVFRVKKMNATHTCGGESWKSPHVTKNWLVSTIKEKIRDSSSHKPKLIAKRIFEDFGIQNAHHGYSLYSLMESFMSNLEGPFHGDGRGSLPITFTAAAQAPTLDRFKMHMEQIKSVSIQAYDWLMQVEPEYWANASFQGERYNQVTHDIGDLYVNWVEEVKDLPIIFKLEKLTSNIMELMNDRRIEVNQWSSILTPTKEGKLENEKLKSHGLKVLFSTDTLFEVHDSFSNVVDMEKNDCTCLEWKASGLPCCHAMAVFNTTHRNVYDYYPIYFTVDSYRKTYFDIICPVTGFKPLEKDEAVPESVVVLPPSTARPVGPQKKRKHTSNLGVYKRTVSCRRCKGEGHNKSTCKVPL
ncbi:hypothetical protein ACFE04_001014 [Oxalis oulophora]